MKQSCEYLSPSTKERLPAYFRALRALLLEGHLRVTSGELSAMTGCSVAQVRSDLRFSSGAGQSGYGYGVKALYTEIAAMLGVGEGYTAVCIGEKAGEGDPDEGMFGRCGVRIIGRLYEEEGEGRLRAALRSLRPDIGVIAPCTRAPERVAALFADCGVGGILNFSDVLIASETVPVRNRAPGDDLLLLCGAMKTEKAAKANPCPMAEEGEKRPLRNARHGTADETEKPEETAKKAETNDKNGKNEETTKKGREHP